MHLPIHNVCFWNEIDHNKCNLILVNNIPTVVQNWQERRARDKTLPESIPLCAQAYFYIQKVGRPALFITSWSITSVFTVLSIDCKTSL